MLAPAALPTNRIVHWERRSIPPQHPPTTPSAQALPPALGCFPSAGRVAPSLSTPPRPSVYAARRRRCRYREQRQDGIGSRSTFRPPRRCDVPSLPPRAQTHALTPRTHATRCSHARTRDHLFDLEPRPGSAAQRYGRSPRSTAASARGSARHAQESSSADAVRVRLR